MVNSAGRRRNYVRFERKVETPDGQGGFTVAWQSYWEGPGEIRRSASQRGDVERLQSGAVGSFPPVQIIVPYDELTKALPQICAGMRAIEVDEGTIMNLNFAQDLTSRREAIAVSATENAPV